MRSPCFRFIMLFLSFICCHPSAGTSGWIFPEYPRVAVYQKVASTIPFQTAKQSVGYKIGVFPRSRRFEVVPGAVSPSAAHQHCHDADSNGASALPYPARYGITP